MKSITLSDVLSKLTDVVESKISREEVARWAQDYYDDDELHLEDDVRKLLYLALMVSEWDVFCNPVCYFYSISQIREWIEEYSN